MIAPTHELTTKEAAALKGVTTAAISRAIREGRLPARAETQPGRARAIWRIRREDLSAWHTPGTRTGAAAEAEVARRAAIIAATGSLAGGTRTLADFLREKVQDLELEDYHPYDPNESAKRGG
jgi:excisionase family DNA binding protein